MAAFRAHSRALGVWVRRGLLFSRSVVGFGIAVERVSRACGGLEGHLNGAHQRVWRQRVRFLPEEVVADSLIELDPDSAAAIEPDQSGVGIDAGTKSHLVGPPIKLEGGAKVPGDADVREIAQQVPPAATEVVLWNAVQLEPLW